MQQGEQDMKRIAAVLLSVGLVAGCGGAPEPENALEDMAESAAMAEAAPAESDGITMFDLPPVTVGPYTVQAMYEERLEDGHFNLRITGGDVAAVREWVGPEDASGVVVVKTEIERDYHHGHVEMPDPIPDDARLWFEIETPDGERLKGSTPLK